MQRNPLFSMAALLLVVTWIIGCGIHGTPQSAAIQTHRSESNTAQTPEADTQPPDAESLEGEEMMSSTPIPTEVEPSAGAEQAIGLARANLAQKLGLMPEAIELLSVEAVEWRDTSLGCPQPGMMYAQVITPGFRVMLAVEGRTYQYHTDQGQVAVSCDEERGTTDIAGDESGPGKLAVPNPQGPYLNKLVAQARKDLAGWLSIEPDQINLLEVKEVVWPDASLGCPQPGMAYKQVPQDGLLIRLSVGGRMYFYHSGGTRDPFLCKQTSQVIPRVTPKTDEFVPPPDSEID